jgi:hypothetical protein
MTAKTLWMAGLVAIALVPLSGRPAREARPGGTMVATAGYVKQTKLVRLIGRV